MSHMSMLSYCCWKQTRLVGHVNTCKFGMNDIVIQPDNFIISQKESKIGILGFCNLINGIVEIVLCNQLTIKLSYVGLRKEDLWWPVLYDNQAIQVQHCSFIFCKVRRIGIQFISIRSDKDNGIIFPFLYLIKSQHTCGEV